MVNCTNILSSGTCNNTSCPHNHNIPVCDTCRRVFKNLQGYDSHFKGKKHRKKEAGVEAPGLVFCHPCRRFLEPGNWAAHTSSQRHRSHSQALGISATLPPENIIPHDIHLTHRFCSYCQIYIKFDAWDKHVRTKGHKEGAKYIRVKMARDEAEKDQNDVEIQGDLNFNVIESEVARQGIMRSLEIRTTAPLAKITLLTVKLSADIGSARRRYLSPFSTATQGSRRQLSTAHPIKIDVSFKEEYIGRYQDRLELQFEDSRLKKTFTISRMMFGIVGDPLTHEKLKSRSPYIPRVRAPREPETRVIEGVRPPALQAIPYVSRLPTANIPKHLLSSLAASSTPSTENIQMIQDTYLPKLLDAESHGRHFKTLVWIEEHKMEQDLERYDMKAATIAFHSPYYHLDIPGLAEKRPSVLIGDRILVRNSDGEQGHWYEGHVHFVHQREVGLRFHGSFKSWSPSQTYHVRFKLNRIPARRQHQALDTAFTQSRILFPNSSHLPRVPMPEPNFTPANPLISTNQAQLQTVASIKAAPHGSLPFVVFGPPGTGKTVTIVEAIKQLLRKDPQIKVLACAPSNSAADLIALRLRDDITEDQMFRLYAPSRSKKQMPDELEQFSYYRDDGQTRPCFGVKPLAVMKKYRVIVSTCISASILPGIGMTRGHFSHIFIDEAGQATEPEVFVSLKMMTDTETNIVLSGDPKQLGPIIRSGIASRLGLEVSYLERLMARIPYDLSTGAGRSVVKLIKNFRSHNAILAFPNKFFYGSDLEPCADSKVINAYLGSHYLPNKKFPVVFHSVSGKDDREASSPSFFNIDEVLQVKAYVEQLRADRVFRTSDQDIGIITPYHAQCLKIRNALRGIANEVKVGSVEEFQGQEHTVIIISTVRSSKDFVSYDVKHTLGFVASPRRFNVAITRAKALLIVIGDPSVLGLDPLWKYFLNYVHTNGGWKGPGIPWDPTDLANPTEEDDAGQTQGGSSLDMNELTRRITTLTFEGNEEELDAGVDRPWRDLD